jgi:hypothetical protein
MIPSPMTGCPEHQGLRLLCTSFTVVKEIHTCSYNLFSDAISRDNSDLVRLLDAADRLDVN